MSKGKIVQVVGSSRGFAISPSAAGNLPRINRRVQSSEQPAKLTLEVQKHLGESGSISMSSTEGFKRGYEATDTGVPISVPVGEGVMGRMLDSWR